MSAHPIKEKVLGLEGRDGHETINVTHVTIRQSIFFLVVKILLIELLAMTGFVIFFPVIDSNLNVIFYIGGILLKMCLVIFVIFQWLEEYYEITPTQVIHKRGFIFKKEDGNALVHLGSVELDQGLLGKLFNYGTLRLYNWATEKEFYLYLIHNPVKYHSILQSLVPDSDKNKHVVREHIIETERL